MKALNKIGWVLFVFFAIGIDLYPYVYLLTYVLAENGLLARKPDIVKDSIV
jgi:energy-converting hydrogenase Eha subunit G